MAITLTPTRRTAIAQSLAKAIDAGSGPGLLHFYTIPRPADPGAAPTGATLLGTLTLSDPCGTASGGVLTFSPITEDASADADGQAAWARLADSDGNGVVDLSVTATGGGGDIQLNSTQVYAGAALLVTAATLTIGGA